MTPLQRFESFDALIQTLLAPLPSPDNSLPRQRARQGYFADLTDYWNSKDAIGYSRQAQLVNLRRSQLLAEVELRTADQTLESGHLALLHLALRLPLPWQRQVVASEQRPQLYRPLLETTRPNWRGYLPGALVILEGGPQGQLLTHEHVSGRALLCTLSHGVEAFDDLKSLHLELCERLDDALQGQSMLSLFGRDSDRDHARNAQRLRYDWFTEDMAETQVLALVQAQQARLMQAWDDAWQHLPADATTVARRLARTADVSAEISSKPALRTRYALLLEKHSPAWLKNSPQQSLTHIVQTMQELVVAIDRAAAPGIPTLETFLQRNGLLAWTRERLRATLRHRHRLEAAPEQILISVTLARQVGPVFHPGLATGYIPAASRPQTGDKSIEFVKATYSLDELALLNISWFDIDYWLTARVHRPDGSAVEQLSPDQVRQMVRELDVGSSYTRFLRTHLLDSPTAQWRQEAYARISQARLRTELVKARYARHFLTDPLEQGYRWAKAVLDYPDAGWRPLVAENRIAVRQLLIAGHTVQGVMLLTPETPQLKRFLVYAPDAPDRRPWREYANAKALLRSLRDTPALHDYVLERMPLANRKTVSRLLRKGRLGPHVERPEIAGDFQHARYRSEVHAVIAAVDASTNTRTELLGETALHTLWLLLDLLGLALPNRALAPLTFARAVIAVLEGLDSLEKEDYLGVMRHMVEAFTNAVDGINSVGGSSVLRRAIRGIPPSPPLTLPPHYQVRPDSSKLHYRIDSVHNVGVFESTSPYPGLSVYYIQDTHGHYYQVAYDGYRWRAVDPRQPDAYTQVAVRRREDGEWVVDSPVLWYDGLPDLTALFDDCRLADVPMGAATGTADGLHEADEQLYLLIGERALPLRAHLLDDHYHLLIPGQPKPTGAAWAILRWHNDEWRIRVRQVGRSSDWLVLPPAYSVSRGSS